MKEPKVAWEDDKMKCWLDEEPFKQCCCNCLNHRRLYYENTFDYYMISDSYSWACVLPYDSEEDLGVHIPWLEHSPGCECYTPKMVWAFKATRRKRCGKREEVNE